MSYIYVVKTISTTYGCNLTMQMNVIACVPSPSSNTSILTASAYTAATNPSCGWSCGCGNVTISSADGLSGELLDFSVGASGD